MALGDREYFGVPAPNSPLRTAVTTLALAATTSPPAPNPEPAAEPAHRRAARYAWALLLARICEVFPLAWPNCGGAMRIIAFITAAPTVRDILVHLGEPAAPPRIAPARGPPLWETAGAEHELTPDPALPPTPADEFDQRIAWSPRPSTLARARRRAGSCLRPPACPRAATLASAPAPKYNDKRAEQPVATEIDP